MLAQVSFRMTCAVAMLVEGISLACLPSYRVPMETPSPVLPILCAIIACNWGPGSRKVRLH